jgi:predicted nucleotidyltransferase
VLGTTVLVMTGRLRESDQVTSHDGDAMHRPGALHRRLAEQTALELSRRGDVEAVLLAGSVARNQHHPSSDVDLLVVGPDSSTLAVRVLVDGLLVERIAHSEAGWMKRLDRPRTSWAYAIREAVPLLDRGAGQRLHLAAQDVFRNYRASDTLRSLLATALWHGQAKLARALSADDRAQGFWSSVMVETLIDGLYTVHDVPLPAGSRRLEHLAEVPLTSDEKIHLEQLLTGSPHDRIAAAAALAETLRAALGPADHEPSPEA